MGVTKEDLQDFTRFADEKLANGAADSLVGLASEWEAQRREVKDAVSDISQCCVDIDAATLSALAAAFPDVEDPRQLQRALGRRGGVTTAELLAKAVAAAEKTNQQ